MKIEDVCVALRQKGIKVKVVEQDGKVEFHMSRGTDSIDFIMDAKALAETPDNANLPFALAESADETFSNPELN